MFKVIHQVSATDENVIKENNEKIIEMLRKIEFMRCMNYAGAFVKPNGITVNWKWPYRVRKAVFSTSPSAIWIW